MKLDGDYVFEAGVQDVWDALFDPAVLAAALPGCEKLERVDGSYIGELKVKIGPIQGKFTGKVDLLDLHEPTSYRMIVDGRGPQGFVKATAAIALAAEGAGTRIRYESEAQIGGKVASVGQRLVETSARAIVKQSLEGLNHNIKLRVAAYQAHQAAAAPARVDTAAAPPDRAPAVVAASAARDEAAAPIAIAPAPDAADAKIAPAPDAAAAPIGIAPDATAAPIAIVPAPDDTAAPIAPAPDATAAAIAPAPVAPAPAGPIDAALVGTPAPIEATPAVPEVAAALVETSVARPTGTAPVVNYKRADAGKLAASVAKEVTKAYAPVIIGVVLAIALLIYVLAR
jgi:hypothetical protein